MRKCFSHIATGLYAVIIIFFLFNIKSFSIENIIKYKPDSILLAILFILFLYALKSVSIVFPCIVLQIVSGMIFPTALALIVNLTGATIDFIIPYYIGKYSGSKSVEKRVKSNKKVAKIISEQREHPFFLSFFLRVISCLPADLVSMYFGALELPFLKYLFASLLGTIPSLIPVTFVGSSIKDIHSPAFSISIAVTIVSSAVSIIVFTIYNKKHSKKIYTK